MNAAVLHQRKQRRKNILYIQMNLQKRLEIDEFNDWLFPHINNSHYRMAFCQSLEAYDEAYEDFYESLDKLDKCLETNRFLFGDYITDSDVRAYVTLARSLP